MTSILATLCLDWAYSINALTGFLFKAAKLSEVRSRLSGPGGGAIWGLPVTGNDWNGRGRPWLDIGWWDWVFPVRVTWSNSRGCWDINLFSGVGKIIFWDESEIKNFQIILHISCIWWTFKNQSSYFKLNNWWSKKFINHFKMCLVKYCLHYMYVLYSIVSWVWNTEKTSCMLY